MNTDTGERTERGRMFPPLRPDRGEPDATLAHRMALLRIGWGEGGRRPDEVSPGSGEGLGVRVWGEVPIPLVPHPCSTVKSAAYLLPLRLDRGEGRGEVSLPHLCSSVVKISAG